MIFKNQELKFVVSPTFINQQTKKAISPEQCIFLDIETVPYYSSFEELSNDLKDRWINKVENWIKYSDSAKAKILDAVFQEFESNENNFDPNLLFDIYKKYEKANPAKQYSEVAGLYPEYGRIICASIGFFKNKEFQKMSFVGSEFMLLSNFQFALNKVHERLIKEFGDVWTVGHNISFFDIPYITKRMAINGLLIPAFLHQAFIQPWNKKVIDTANEWRVGNTTGDATMETIMLVLGMSNPKSGIVSGENMSKYYYSDDSSIEEIVTYCENDIESLKNLFVYLQNLKVSNV